MLLYVKLFLRIKHFSKGTLFKIPNTFDSKLISSSRFLFKLFLIKTCKHDQWSYVILIAFCACIYQGKKEFILEAELKKMHLVEVAGIDWHQEFLY